MNEDKMIRENIHMAVDECLSQLEVKPSLRNDILSQTRGEIRMKRKLSASLVLAAALLLAMAAIGIAAARFGILEYNHQQAENEAYVEHILAVDEMYENEYLTLTINDAVFDGTYLSMTMDIQPKENCGDGVYVYPWVTATCNGQELEVEIESYLADFFNGFWVPERDEGIKYANGQYGVKYAIYTEELDFDTQMDEVTWTVNFDIIKPVYEIESTKMVLSGNVMQEEWQAYERLFPQAYRDRKILLEDGYSLIEYAAGLPEQPDISEEGWRLWKLPQRLTASGAFEWIDRAKISFTTQESGIKVLSSPQTFDLGDYEVTVNSLSISFDHCNYKLEVVKKPGKGKTAGQEYADNDGQWYFAVLADSCGTQMEQSGQGLKYGTLDEPGAEMYYEGTVVLKGETDSVTFVPCWREADELQDKYPDEDVYEAQRPLTPEQEALMFTIKAE